MTEFTSQVLQWRQPSGLDRIYELRGGGELLATLRFTGGTLAEAETAEGRWTFKRQGFWHPQVTVRTPESDVDVAVFRPHMGGGSEIVTGLGSGLEFTSANFWHSEWIWRDQDQAIVTYLILLFGRDVATRSTTNATIVSVMR